jgi:hypothetical protein
MSTQHMYIEAYIQDVTLIYAIFTDGFWAWKQEHMLM